MKSLKLFILSALMLISNFIYAEEPKASLVLDMRNIQHLPKNFRTSSYPVKNSENINLEGLRDLHIAGSGQFSRLAFTQALDYIPSKNVIVVDLRQESHGFLNANAISWYGENNAVNNGMAPQEIEIKQHSLLQSLLDKVTISLAEPKKHNNDVKSVEYLVHSASSENDLMHQLAIPYHRFYVQDHHIPDAAEVDRFIIFVQQQPKDSWLYFHCRAGRGRTSTFMLMYDILHNAHKVSLKDMLKRQAAIGGKDLLQLPSPSDPKYKAAVARIAFIKKFYRYVFENKDNFQTTWSQWPKKIDSNKNKNLKKASYINELKFCHLSPLARNMTMIGNII